MIRSLEESIKKYNNKVDASNPDHDLLRELIARLEFKKQCTEIFVPLGVRYVEEALNCVKEAYQMTKAALIKCVGSASNFSESQIERVVKVAMIETEMCFV